MARVLIAPPPSLLPSPPLDAASQMVQRCLTQILSPATLAFGDGPLRSEATHLLALTEEGVAAGGHLPTEARPSPSGPQLMGEEVAGPADTDGFAHARGNSLVPPRKGEGAPNPAVEKGMSGAPEDARAGEESSRVRIGFAFADVAGGSIFVGSLLDDASRSALSALLAQVLPHKMRYWPRGGLDKWGSAAVNPFAQQLIPLFLSSCFPSPPCIHSHPCTGRRR